METVRTSDNLFIKDFKESRVDSRITYPSYKSFDEFIDLKHLVSLDRELTELINRRIKTQNEDYFLNLYRLDAATPYQPGVREIWLSCNEAGLPVDYLDLVDEVENWEPTAATEEFTGLMDFLKTLPFRATGPILIIYDDAGKEVPAHRDHLDTNICHEFIWFRTNRKKPFYVLNQLTNEKKYVESYSAWCDSVNQYHGSEAVDGLSFSIRVDGIFTDEFRKLIPRPEINMASTPALWGCLS